MTTRYTRREVDQRFDLFCETLGVRRAADYADVDGFVLDYAAGYGGYAIWRVSSATGGYAMPFGPMRHSAGELVEMMAFARYAHDLAADTIAMSRLHAGLTGREWHASDWDIVSDAITSTGRVIAGPDDQEERVS